MPANRIETARVNITIVDKLGENNTEEFRLCHAAHQIIYEYQRLYGADLTQSLMDELVAYHSARITN